MSRRLLPLGALVVAVLAAACGAGEDDADSQEGAATPGAGNPIFGDDQSMFQDDRVGQALKASLGQVPQDYASNEPGFDVIPRLMGIWDDVDTIARDLGDQSCVRYDFGQWDDHRSLA